MFSVGVIAVTKLGNAGLSLCISSNDTEFHLGKHHSLQTSTLYSSKQVIR